MRDCWHKSFRNKKFRDNRKAALAAEPDATVDDGDDSDEKHEVCTVTKENRITHPSP